MSSKLQNVTKAQQAAETALSAVIAYLKQADKPTSEAAHARIDETLDSLGFDSPEGHIVAAGAPSHEPHEVGQGPIERGVPIVIDIYPRSRATGYWGDLTRTICLGTPTKELERMYDVVLQAQELAFSMIQPGTTGADIHHTVADYFSKHGYKTSGTGREFKYAEGFVHALGHGVTTNIHADPTLSPASEDVLQVGDVITIEPALYYQTIGGIRIEDLVVVTDTGYKNLTTFPKTFVL